MKFCFTVTKECSGQTVEQILKDQFQISSHLLKNIRLYGSLTCDGIKIKTNDIASNGCTLLAEWDFNGTEAGDITSKSIPVLFQDECFVIVDKPKNLCVHPSRGHSQDSLITVLSGGNHLNVVTRLDRDTSGIVILAKNGHWHNRMSQTEIIKLYYGLVHGHPLNKEGIIHAPIEREEEGSIKRIVRPDGKSATTAYQVLEYIEESHCSLMEFRLFTGRCHQIRVHSSYLGCPLVGDTLYGDKGENLKIDGQRLLCGQVQFIHPKSGELIKIRIPDYKERLLQGIL